MHYSRSPLVGVEARRHDDKRDRIVLFSAWLLLVTWLWSTHVLWRDEVRAFSLALSGSNVVEMLNNVHGEGHPALWYLILRGAHTLFPYREVLPIAGAILGIAAMAILTFASPFRTVVIAIVLFSAYGAFEYVVIARNYGISALVMFSIAALYGRIRNRLWLGAMIALLCNTNVPSCIIAAAFLGFRFVEMLTDERRPERRDWFVFAGNAAFAAVGAFLCFITVYPTFNDAAVSTNFRDLTPAKIVAALLDSNKGFSHLLLGPWVLAISCLAFVRKPAALFAAAAGLVMLKLFFYFVYESFYRHEILYVIFLLSLFWITATGAGGEWRSKKWMNYLQLAGSLSFTAMLAIHSMALATPIKEELAGRPYSHSADVAKLLQKRELSGAIVMGDPDTMLEPLPYYVDNPLWMLRQQRFGKFVRLTRNARVDLTLDEVLADADRLHRQTARPIVFLSHLRLRTDKATRTRVMFEDATILTPDSVRRFLASTRHIATLRGSQMGDEDYDVFVYPR